MDSQRFFSRFDTWVRANKLAWSEITAKKAGYEAHG